MCVQYMKIKSAQSKAPRSAFVPCGVCEECRQSKKNQWTFRLRCELEYCRKMKYQIGFFTLTYDDAHLPHLPRVCFKSGYKRVQCFSRYDVRTFIDNIRKRLNERFGVSGLRYMVCSELGSSTQRSHYHGLICFPSSVPAPEVFKLLHSQWTKGFVFPRYIDGGLDSHGYRHKPFLLAGDVQGAAAYAAKYCCKDLNFVESLKGLDIDRKSILFKCSSPFHIQSRSIGLTFLQNQDSRTLLALLKNGASFVGQKSLQALPIYIKNKVLFSPDYVFESCPSGDWWFDFQDNRWRYKKGQGTHKRLVRRKATDFFVQNVKEIFNQKADYYESLFTDMMSKDFWTSRQVDKSFSQDISVTLQKMSASYGFGARTIAEGYLSYYGVPKHKAFFAPLEYVFLSHYKPMKFGKNFVDSIYYAHLSELCSFAFGALHYSVSLDVKQRDKVAKIIDFYKHQL